jgi:hypothetical protein
VENVVGGLVILFLVILGIGFSLLPILSIVIAARASQRSRALEERVDLLQRRLAHLSEELSDDGTRHEGDWQPPVAAGDPSPLGPAIEQQKLY